MFMTSLRGALAAALLALAASPASALAIFDGTGLTSGFSGRGAGSAPLAYFTFDQETTIGGISAVLDSSASGNIKFLIFDGSTLAYEGASMSLIDTAGFAEVFSAPLSYTFLTGHDYFVGAIADVAASWSFGVGDVSQNGVNNISRNQNVVGFNDPFLEGQAGAAIAVSLYGDLPGTGGGDAVVPLPAAAPLLGFGLAALGFAARRRRG